MHVIRLRGVAPHSKLARMTQAYVTTKIVAAWPQTGPEGEEGYAIRYPDGHTSWCPKEEFERTSRLVTSNELSTIQIYISHG